MNRKLQIIYAVNVRRAAHAIAWCMRARAHTHSASALRPGPFFQIKSATRVCMCVRTTVKRSRVDSAMKCS